MTNIASLIEEQELIDLTQRMIQTPSPSGQEDEIAGLVARAMTKLGFDTVDVDEMNNVIGRINPRGKPTIMLNGHIDHAGTGNMDDPFAGSIMDGTRFGRSGEVIYGRGACDMKGAVAAMIHGAAALKKASSELRGGVVLTAVALEERGEGEGTRYVLQNGVTADLAICGEATNMRVNVGHRGKFNIKVTTRGSTSHACNPGRGVNAIDKMRVFLSELEAHYRPPQHEILGQCTHAVVDIWATPGWESPTIPDTCSAVIDRRTLPGESREDVLRELDQIAEAIKRRDPEFILDMEIITETSPMFIDPDHEAVRSVQASASDSLSRPVEVGTWLFGTDAPYINQCGIPCIGFGPGDETHAHTGDDHLAVEDLLAAARVYANILRDHCL